MRTLILIIALVAAVTNSLAEESYAPDRAMDNRFLGELIKRLDSDATGGKGTWQLTVEGRSLLVISDEGADRMRIMSQLADAGGIKEGELRRLLQANFDSALDARYAVANNKLWSAYLHPMRALETTEFFSGVAQVVNLAATYGESYSSGAIVFRGGDSAEIERERYQRITDKAGAI